MTGIAGIVCIRVADMADPVGEPDVGYCAECGESIWVSDWSIPVRVCPHCAPELVAETDGLAATAIQIAEVAGVTGRSVAEIRATLTAAGITILEDP